MKPIFLSFRAPWVALIALGLALGATGRGATVESILRDMKRFLPDAKATLIPAASVAPGRYATNIFGGLDEVYLFPDGAKSATCR